MVALVLVGLLVGRGTARAQIPEVPCPTVECSCGVSLKGSPPDCSVDCPSACPDSSDAAGGGGGSTTRQQGTPPILKLAAGVVAGAVLATLFVLAPGHTVGMFGHPQSAAAAREAWDAHERERASLEWDGKRADRQARELTAVARLATDRPLVRVGAGYAPVETRPPVDRWAPNGACAEVIDASTALIEQADREATTEARKQFPTWADVQAAAKKATREGLARLAGPAKYAKQRVELLKRYDEAKQMVEFMAKLEQCAGDPDPAASNACLLLLAEQTNAELRPLLDELQPGAKDAAARVDKAAKFYRGYVSGLERELEKQSLAAVRCQR